ncbi:hypothetical protein HOS79_gp055 [Lactobacillus phage Nyseid]|uniref:Uncharacterized protein n=1 Tax=Lactobacillus phage Nyseid TaxID=2079432 RepID=A0A2K9VC94_9CAUD|nr:hypothetical protein HOS79_gp055 [Lactobacillus phage Nyseid]AUV59815.1 hypothetical protein [Lactobacillus phage Nyseid]
MLNVSEYKRKIDLEEKDENLKKYEEFMRGEIKRGYDYVLLSCDKDIGIGLTYERSSPLAKRFEDKINEIGYVDCHKLLSFPILPSDEYLVNNYSLIDGILYVEKDIIIKYKKLFFDHDITVHTKLLKINY